MPHHARNARQAEREAARAEVLAARTDRRARPRPSNSPDPWWQSTDAHEGSAARMRSTAAALREFADIERKHEDAHGDEPTADGEHGRDARSE